MQAKESQVYVYTNDGVNLYYTDFIGHIDTNDIDHTLHWKKYALMKADANLYMGGIVSKLEALKLNETEIRFCLLTMLDLPLKQIANTINYSSAGIKTLKKRISIKLSTTPQNLRIFLFFEGYNYVKQILHFSFVDHSILQTAYLQLFAFFICRPIFLVRFVQKQ